MGRRFQPLVRVSEYQTHTVRLHLSKNVESAKTDSMHQGTNYRYASWQPVNTSKVTMGTKPPYYGNIAVAAMVSPGNQTGANVSILNIPLPSIFEAAYAAYVNGALARILVINMVEYNYTTNTSTPNPRPSSNYSFSVSDVNGIGIKVQRLMANGSNAISGVTFDGYSYNYELDNGKPVLLKNVTRGETARITNGVITVGVPDSSVAILNFS